ncbi:alpha-glucuronidase [Mucilaginibacter mali]|uniref:Xylan alpha-1,2-glucuronidase n=2 Tax=Mucilaginibacter mali TaxID=2740462 RepID=A0A7D4U0U1_9SPHI|nr:alpha-glucuronidase [Mucilaginibacter mali]
MSIKLNNYRLKGILLLFILTGISAAHAEDGYRLWLRYDAISNKSLAQSYRSAISQLVFPARNPVLDAAKKELRSGLKGLLQHQPAEVKTATGNALVIGMPQNNSLVAGAQFKTVLNGLGTDGYFIRSVATGGKNCLVIGANTDKGVLYGVFNLLRLLQTNKPIDHLNTADQPSVTYRILDHWDNLNRTVERGYAGFSIWNWHKLPEFIDPRYLDYARANASIGINGTVLNNVNANALSLTNQYLVKAAAIANALRPYGIRVYLSARFSAPIEIGGLKTADPLDPTVKKWWADKADEIYRLIPDFGGFLVKANSEGQPGPQSYGRNHADGANMLADAVAPHHGIVMWRAFVYDNNVPDDRAKQAYNEFKPLDGQFRSNVIIQVKNGAIDFQPREPFHPLFGAMPKTALMLELQITQEYLGFSTHLVYEAPLVKECLDADTYSAGKGSTVVKVLTGKMNPDLITGIAGVANIGTDMNWCGHPFAQANWYAFGRLAWNPAQTSTAIADDWLRMTFSNSQTFVADVKKFMLQSRENTVNYMTPLGLHHIMAATGHYGPGPWDNNLSRADWNPIYYHKADANGIGFDRTTQGSNAVGQYAPQVRDAFNNLAACPDIYLLWFHHLPWNYKMRSGETLWNELVDHYYRGVDSVRAMQQIWNRMGTYVDSERFTEVQQLMNIQLNEATRWRDACVQYFQTFSNMPIPAKYPRPLHPLQYYKDQRFNFVPGTGGSN